MARLTKTQLKDATLEDNETVSVEVKTTLDSIVFTQIDDGNEDTPEQYDLVQKVAPSDDEPYMPFATVTGSTATSFSDRAIPGVWKTELTNTSGGSATFRLRTFVWGDG